MAVTKSQSVLELQLNSSSSEILFVSPDRDELPENKSHLDNRKLRMDALDWQDFGCPHVITITIVPGDALNEDEE